MPDELLFGIVHRKMPSIYLEYVDYILYHVIWNIKLKIMWSVVSLVTCTCQKANYCLKLTDWNDTVCVTSSHNVQKRAGDVSVLRQMTDIHDNNDIHWIA